jgi:translation initiation factor IF-2
MTKVKVFQLAKELNISSKELIYHLEELGIMVKNHASTLIEDEINQVKEVFSKMKKETKPKKVIVRKKMQGPPPSEVPPVLDGKKEKIEIEPEKTLTKEELTEISIPPLEYDLGELKTTKPAETLEEKPQKKKKEEDLDIEEGKKRKKLPPSPKRRRHVIIEMFEEEEPAIVPSKKVRPSVKPAAKKEEKPTFIPPKPIKRRIEIGKTITVAELARAIGVKATEVIKRLMNLGVMSTINQALDYETAALVASEFDYEVKKTSFVEEDVISAIPDKPQALKTRPPVVTVMGHVDHGKTSLLDAIRHTNIITTEAGNITQHIGAYYVSLDKGNIVFLDTPGHEAFTAMRARGAQVTDIVVLVVAADDGVMEQTKEAINHAKEAKVPIVVAINKIDKPNANVEKVKRELAKLGLVPEEWGGDTLYSELSAKKTIGIEHLLELILLQTEMLELKANPDKPARGIVIEARLDKGKGPVATVLIKEGTLKTGDHFVCGFHYGKIRAMFDSRGTLVKEMGPSLPVEIQGISDVPEAGDYLIVVESEKLAKEISYHRQQKQKEEALIKAPVSLENIYKRFQEGEVKELKLVVKADVQGSVEVLKEALTKLSTQEIKVNVIHASTGVITESDITLASASHAIVIGFNTRATAKVMELAQKEGVDVRFYEVIYQLLDDIQDAMRGLLEPEYREKKMGEAKIKQVFKVSKVGMIAGCYVESGEIDRSYKIRILRDGTVIHDGRLVSLKRFKEDIKLVKAGYECGMSFETFQDIKAGDIVEAYVVNEVEKEVDFKATKEETPK